MKEALIYVHGKGGNADEAEHYKKLFVNKDVFGLTYNGTTPWDTKEEFLSVYENLNFKYDRISVIANSIGAYFTMNALWNKKLEKSYFISPIVNMEDMILNMMRLTNTSEEDLCKKRIIHTNFGENLSWEYLCYVREHKFVWNIPTYILYGENDSIVKLETVERFAQQYGAKITIMHNGEHWFHTTEQMNFLDSWIKSL